MRFPFRAEHVRTRLTLWYVSILAGVLLISWGLTATFLFLQMRGQLDHYAVQDIETIEGLLYFDRDGRLILREDYHNHPQSRYVLERLVDIRAPNGAVLFRNERLGNQSLGGEPTPEEGLGGYSVRTAHLADGDAVRMASRRHTLDGRPLLIRLGYSEQPIWARFEEFVVASLLALPLVLALSGIAGYLLARRALLPLEEMARRAGQITSDNLNARLPVGAVDDELGNLARVFNKLLARLEESFEQLRRFTADASHELRTPLTSIRSVGEVALQTNVTTDDYRDAIGSMLEEVNRLTELVDSLLTISRADAGRIQLHPAPLSVIGLVREAAGLFEVLIEDKGQRIAIGGDDSVKIYGDPVFLRQAVVNIIHNAVKFSPSGGVIGIAIQRDSSDQVRIEIADNGPGISPEHAQHVFDRFYRVDESRSRDAGGAGLGLSIAQWAVRVHGGRIQVKTVPGEGSVFQIFLPAMPLPADRDIEAANVMRSSLPS
jgi:heavy metal sensor kinase